MGSVLHKVCCTAEGLFLCGADDSIDDSIDDSSTGSLAKKWQKVLRFMPTGRPVRQKGSAG
jgi:hypothetical protein